MTSLRIKQPYGNVFWKAIIILGISILAIEGSIRLAIHLNIIAVPGVGTGNADLNVKIPLLDEYLNDNGRINCIFLGSSMTNDAVIPEVFSERYKQLSGKEIACFNFGVATLTGEVAGGLGPLLVERYHPDLLIYGTSARDYSKVLGSGGLRTDPWYQYQLGDWNFAGWLKEYSMIYRIYMGILINLNPATREYAMEVKNNTTPSGHFVIRASNLDMENQSIIKEEQLNSKDFNGLKRLTALNNSTTRIIVMEVPVNPNFLPFYVNNNPEDYNKLFYKRAKTMLDNRGIPFIATITGGQFAAPDDQWADLKHLNYEGAQNFSSWLAEQIWELENTGVIERIEWEN